MFINSSLALVPSFEFESIIAISLSAATAAILTASASPLVPFTTAISDISFILSNLSAIASAVSSLVAPCILSISIFKAFNSVSIFLVNVFSPPITYTFLTPSLFNSSFVFSFNLSFPVKSIGAFSASANGVAASASAIELSFTITALSDLLHPFLLTSIAVSHLPAPTNLSSDTDFIVSAYPKFPALDATNVTAKSAAIFFGNFI